jgi:hypothetical protein
MDELRQTHLTPGSWFQDYTWLPIPLCLGAITILWAADFRVVWHVAILNILVH